MTDKLLSFLGERIKELKTERDDLKKTFEKEETDLTFLEGRIHQIEEFISPLEQHCQNLTEI